MFHLQLDPPAIINTRYSTVPDPLASNEIPPHHMIRPDINGAALFTNGNRISAVPKPQSPFAGPCYCNVTTTTIFPGFC